MARLEREALPFSINLLVRSPAAAIESVNSGNLA